MFRLWVRLFVGFVVLLALVGCVKPQIISPMASGFSLNEYMVVEAITKSRLGQLYMALQEVDDKGRPIPLRWSETTVLLFPQGVGVNDLEEVKFEQTRKAVETTGKSGKLTAAAFATLDGKNSSAYKYESKSTKFFQLKMPLQYNPNAKTFIKKKLKENSAYRFAYLAALYEGSSYAEVLYNATAHGAGNYAAFQIDGDYYTTSNASFLNAEAPIIYRLLPVDLDQLTTKVEPGVKIHQYAPLSSQQIDSILKETPKEFRMMINTE